MKDKMFARAVMLCLWWASLCPVMAQWKTQNVVVSNGWTAAYLFVDASSLSVLPATQYLPIAPDNPIDQIWMWKTPASDAQYLNNPLSPLSGGGQWISWTRTNSQNSLTALIPNAAYLIHSTAPSNYVWRIQGRPTPPSYNWDMTGLNFIGFSTPATNPPNFQNYFGQDPAIASLVQIFQYVGGDFSTNPANPAQVLSEYTTPVNRGQAYWVSATNAYNAYFGPFNLTLPNPAGLDYGVSGGQFTLHLVNVTPNVLTVYLSLSPSEAPPYGQTNIVGAPPLLLEGALNSSNLTYAYTSVPANGAHSASWTLPPAGQPGADVAIVLGVNRFAMANASGSLYAGILQFTDSLGFSEVNIPVTATAANTSGLWIGNASITGVSYDLKSYATNSDGSLELQAVTNRIVTTNALALPAATNLLVNNFAITNQTVSYFQVTNQVINTYTLESYQLGTNGYVVTTNEWVGYTELSDLVTETEVTGYYFTNNGALLVWETTNVTYAPLVLTSAGSTNWEVVTNLIAAVPTNGTPVQATNWVFMTYAITNEVVTNGIFMAPVTNEVVYDYGVTNSVAVTNAADNLVGSNLVATGTVATTSWSYASNSAAPVTLLLTNSVAGFSLLSLGGNPQLVPGGTYYLGVQNTNATAVSFALSAGFHLTGGGAGTGIVSEILATNGGFLLSWLAPSNDLFAVQWAAGLGAAWQTYAAPPYVSYDTNYPATATNAHFSYFDKSAAGAGPDRFYRLVLPGVQGDLGGGQVQSNTVAPGGTVYYAVSVPGAADAGTNVLWFAGAPVNLLFSAVAPAGMNTSNSLNSTEPVATAYTVTNSPVGYTLAGTNYFPMPKPLFAVTNGLEVTTICVETNNYFVDNQVYNNYTTNVAVVSNNYVVVSGATNWMSSTTNVVASTTSQSSSLATNFSFNISLIFATNAAYAIVTNQLVSSVSNYVVTAHNTALDAVSAPFPLRLIVFNDSNGNCSLLQRVYYGVREETNVVVATTERVLDADHLNSARRISATALPWTPTNTIWHFSGGPLGQGGTLSTTVLEPYDDQAANPFLHTYHPDHNNLTTADPPHELPKGSESYDISRQITLSVAANTSDFISLTTANSSLTGNYYETIMLVGLGGATKAYQTSGTFALKRVSTIATLTTQ